MRQFSKWLSDTEGETRAPEDLPAELISKYITDFLEQSKRSNGEQYEPTTIHSKLLSIVR